MKVDRRVSMMAFQWADSMAPQTDALLGHWKALRSADQLDVQMALHWADQKAPQRAAQKGCQTVGRWVERWAEHWVEQTAHPSAAQ